MSKIQAEDEPSVPSEDIAEREMEKAERIGGILSGKIVTPRQLRLRREREKKRMEREQNRMERKQQRVQQREEKKAQRKRKREEEESEKSENDGRRKSICEGLDCTIQLQNNMKKRKYLELETLQLRF